MENRKCESVKCDIPEDFKSTIASEGTQLRSDAMKPKPSYVFLLLVVLIMTLFLWGFYHYAWCCTAPPTFLPFRQPIRDKYWEEMLKEKKVLESNIAQVIAKYLVLNVMSELYFIITARDCKC